VSVATLVDFLNTNCRRYPDKTAVISAGCSWAYRDLDVMSTRVARNLMAHGIAHGDRVALHFLNGWELAVLYFACFKAGAIAVPVNTRLQSVEVDHLLAHCGASRYIAQPELARGAPATDALTFEALQCEPPAAIELPCIAADDVAAILYTSGTTARPKGVVHSHRTLLWWLPHPPPRDPTAVAVIAMPMVHIAALASFLSSMAVGATAVLLPIQDPSMILDAIERHRGTATGGAPALCYDLLDAQMAHPRDVSSMRSFGVGGDAAPAALHDRFVRVFGRPLREFYGATEVIPIALNGFGPGRPGSFGRAAPGSTIRLLDEDGRDVGSGEVGEIVVRSPGVALRYWDDPTATAESLRDGCFVSGDRGSRDADGYLWFAGRKKEIIVHRGSNVSYQEVEAALWQHPAIRDVAVVGLPDAASGEIVAACVVLRPDCSVTEAEVIGFARARLAEYKCPEKVFLVEQVPKTVAGKPSRTALRQLIPASTFPLP
jgi:long-chain acyl-CoA synthetase